MDLRESQAAANEALALSETRLKASEHEFRTLADSAPVLMWVTDAQARFEFINQASFDFIGRSAEAGFNPRHNMRLSAHPDDADRIVGENIEGRAARGEFALEGRFKRADGEWRWLRSVSRPRFGPEGEFIGYASVGYDVTDAKRAEHDLRRINDLLGERVEAAVAERDKAQAALHQAQKMEAVGELTGGVAHDFNNLLTVIIGALDLVERHPGDAMRRGRMIAAALGAARRGERLTQQLLAFARRQELKPQGASIDRLLRESEPLLRRAVGEAVSLVVAPGAPDAVAMIDTGQFEAAVMNLVVNARDAVNQGGAIRVESAACDLAEGEVEGVSAGAYVRVVVHDTGVGMDAATVARAFEPFFTTKKMGKGTGLGLSQAYGFARQSGGGVTLDSALGEGSSVKLYLPQASVLAAEEPPAEPLPSASAAITILLVEDDVAVGDMVAAMLENLGHKVFRADSAEPALALVKELPGLELLLTDLIMPGGRTGVDLAHDAVKLRPHLPVILSSGYAGEASSSAASAPWPLLRKPYSLDTLVRAIDQALDATRSVA
jgi:PAS domain S-box-containing protein